MTPGSDMRSTASVIPSGTSSRRAV
jgi:hypothetical protein